MERVHPTRRILCIAVLCLVCLCQLGQAWEWSDFVGDLEDAERPKTLSMQEVADLRVRDIKRRLARTHGYSADEVARMLDKKELIQALAFEEEKVRLESEDEVKRKLVKQGIIVAVVVVLIGMCWPLIKYAYEFASVNFVVFVDKKRYEATRCWELQSYWGMVGVSLMLIVELLQMWLTGSILLSWVMSSRYFFPTPKIPLRPAQLMGGEVASGPMGKYGLNVGPMVITWGLRFVAGKLEVWTGQALSKSHRKQRKVAKERAREQETPDERAARKQARREAKRAAQEELEYQQAMAASLAMNRPSQPDNSTGLPPTTLSSWMEPVVDSTPLPYPDPKTEPTLGSGPQSAIRSSTHEEFLKELESHTSELDEVE